MRSLARFALALCAAPYAAAQSTYLDFEIGAPCDVSQAVAASDEYAHAGITFFGPAPGAGPVIVEGCAALGLEAREGRSLLVAAAGQSSASGPADGPIRMRFSPPIDRFRFHAASAEGGGNYRIVAYRSGAQVLDTFGGSYGWMRFSLNVPGGVDALVIERIGASRVWGIDAMMVTRCEPTVGTTTCDDGVPFITTSSCLSAFGMVTGGGPYSDLTFRLGGGAANAIGLLLASDEGNWVPYPGGTPHLGQLCLSGPPILRVPGGLFSTDADGNGVVTVDLTTMVPPGGNPVLPGDTWYFQAWHRVVAAPGYVSTGLTNGLEIRFQ